VGAHGSGTTGTEPNPLPPPPPRSLCERKFHPRNLVGLIPFKAIAKWRQKHGAPFSASDPRFAASQVYEPALLCVFCTQFFHRDFSDFLSYHRGKTDKQDAALLLEGNREGSDLDKRITRRLQAFTRAGGRCVRVRVCVRARVCVLVCVLERVGVFVRCAACKGADAPTTDPHRRRPDDSDAYDPDPRDMSTQRGGQGEGRGIPPVLARPYSRLSFQVALAALRNKREVPLLMSDLGCELARYSMLQVRAHVVVHVDVCMHVAHACRCLTPARFVPGRTGAGAA
jgi:hypothetical protein